MPTLKEMLTKLKETKGIIISPAHNNVYKALGNKWLN
jgi:hypothetical protein